MSEKYIIQQLALAFPNAGDIVDDIIQLSDGTAVFVTRQQDGEAVNLWYVTGSRTAPVLIHQLTDNTFSTHKGSPVGTVALCIDDADNIYLVGTAYGNTAEIACHAYQKGGGLTWTPIAPLTSTQEHSGVVINQRVVWCNTGGTGGAGQLMVLVNLNGSPTGAMEYEVLDAGAALAGAGTLSPVALNGLAAFLGCQSGAIINFTDGNAPFDMENDSVGGTSGIVAFATPLSGGQNGIFVGGWEIDSSGNLITDNAISRGEASSAQQATNLQIRRTSTGVYCLVYTVETGISTFNGSGAWAVSTWSNSARLTAPVSSATTTPATDPLPNYQAARTHGWSCYWDGGTIWVLAVLSGRSSSRQNDVVMLGFVPGSGWATSGSYIDTVGLDDQTSLINVAVAPYIIDGTYQDFWVYALNSTGCFYYGDFVYLGALTPPSTPTLTVGTPDPVSGVVVLTVTGSDGSPDNQKAVVEYSDDGVNYTILPGFNYIPTDGSQTATGVDATLIPGASRLYQARIRNDVVTGVPVDSANTSPEASSTFVPVDDNGLPTWVLLDPANPSAFILFTPLEFQTNREETQGIFQPIGAAFPVVITDTVQGSDGTLKIELFDNATYQALEFFKALQQTLLMQSPYGEQWYIRFASPRTAGSSGSTFSERKMTMQASELFTPWRIWEQAYIEVARPVA